jgi:hypothetical protein
MTSLVSQDVKRCFFVPTSFGDSLLTNTGASLEVVLKRLHVRSLVQVRGWGFGAKNWDAFLMFSFSSKLLHHNASWISTTSWYSECRHTDNASASDKSSPGLLEEEWLQGPVTLSYLALITDSTLFLNHNCSKASYTYSSHAAPGLNNRSTIWVNGGETN